MHDRFPDIAGLLRRVEIPHGRVCSRRYQKAGQEEPREETCKSKIVRLDLFVHTENHFVVFGVRITVVGGVHLALKALPESRAASARASHWNGCVH